MSVGQVIDQQPLAGEKASPPELSVLWQRIVSVAKTQQGMMLIGAFILVTLALWPIIVVTPNLWFSSTSYYQHGPLIPFAILYLFALRLPEWRKYPVKPSILPVFLLPIPLYLTYAMARDLFNVGFGTFYLVSLFLLAWSMLGGKWALRMTPYLAFFSLAIPMWTRLIESTTSPWQILSTKIAFKFLQMMGQWPSLESPTVINLPHWTLNIEVACSGMKMTLAMVAMAVFVMLAARLKWWGNLIIALVAIPWAIFMNGVRIGIIGFVGNIWGEANGMLMHDYGSYVVMGFAFWVMYILAKWLGWKI